MAARIAVVTSVVFSRVVLPFFRIGSQIEMTVYGQACQYVDPFSNMNWKIEEIRNRTATPLP
jgi:hypothetical protein